jgi:hypothetical protein
MPETDSSSFQQFAQLLNRDGVDRALDWLQAKYTNERRYRELFEVLKMQARFQLGLPVMASEVERSAEQETQKQLDNLLFQACGQVGELLFRDGQAARGWSYFQMVGDRPRAAELLRSIPADAENSDEISEIALEQRVAPDYGIQLILQFRGTCEAITRLQSTLPIDDIHARSHCAAKLLRHVADELTHNVQAEIEKKERKKPTGGGLMDWVGSRQWLFERDGFQIDPSHLSATVRLGRMTDEPEALVDARILCRYGQKLNPMLVGAGPSPFEEFFRAHEIYYSAAVGEDVAGCLAYFRDRLMGLDPAESSWSDIADVVVDLLCRNQRYDEALDILFQGGFKPRGQEGLVPDAFEIARRGNLFDRLAQWFEREDRLLEYTAALALAQSGRANKR